MEAVIVISTKNAENEDLRSLLQMVREWELRTPTTEIVGMRFETDPELSGEEVHAIFAGIFPDFGELVNLPAPKANLLRLGTRAIAVGNQILGTCSELTLSIGQASEEDLKKLEAADRISLVRIASG